MHLNSLARPVAKLQPLLTEPAPWSFIASRLVALLSAYSTGLSFPVAADEIAAAWSRHLRVLRACPRVLVGTVTHVARVPPEIWLVALPHERPVAVYAHSNYFGVVAPGALVAFDAACLIAPPAPRGRVAEQLRLVREAFRDVRGAVEEAPRFALRTPAAKEKAVATSDSPVDVARYPGRRPQPQTAATPSQEFDPALPGAAVTRIVMPTPNLFFDLDSVELSVLALEEPPHAFSLQRVWNERCLTPRWVYAVVAEIVRAEGSLTVRLHDFVDCEEADQPSVLWNLPEEMRALAEILKPGYHVLIANLMVQPNGNSFDLECTALTTCYYSKRVSSALSNTVDNAVLRDITNVGPREGKRRRTDPVLANAASTVSTSDVSNLASPHSQQEFACHARVVAAPLKRDSVSMIIPCENGVTVTVAGSELMRRAMRTKTGDEILFQGMKYESANISPDESRPCGWIAGSMDNISTMTGVLFSPIFRQLQPLKDCFAEIVGKSSSCAWTAHVLVRIRGVVPRRKEKELFLKVSDWNNTITSSLTQAIASGGPAGGHQISDTEQRDEKDTQWQVKVRDNCFESLFWSQTSDSMWEGEGMGKVIASLPRLQESLWLMTLIFCSKEQGCLPDVSACAPCQRNSGFC